MKWTLATIVALIFAVTSTGTNAQRSAPGPLTIDTLIDIRHPSNPIWSPDGAQVLFTWDRAGVSSTYLVGADGAAPPREFPLAGAVVGWQADGLLVMKDGDLWRQPLDGRSATAIWTTAAAESGVELSPDGTRAAFVRGPGPAAGGGGRGGRGGRGGGTTGPSEIWVRSLGDGAETRVAAVDSGVAGLSWSPDGQRLSYSSGAGTIRHEQTPPYSGAKIIYTVTERTPGRSFVVPVSGGSPAELTAGGGRWLDGTHLLVDRTSDFTRRTIEVTSVDGGQPRPIAEEVDPKFWSITGDAGARAQVSPDGRWIAFVSDRDGWDHLYVVPAAGGAPVQITKGAFEAWRPAWSPDGHRLAFDANAPGQPGTRHLSVVDLSSGTAGARPEAITTGRGTNIAPRWSPDGTRLLYQHTDPQNSADLFVVEARPGATPVRLTSSMPAAIDKTALVEPELIQYPGPDGTSIPAWLFVPKNLDRSKRHPAVVWIHGDGVNQSYDGWHVQRNYAVYYSFHQYLLQQGYVVIAPDYRGSIGYGRDWRQGVYMDVGGNDAKDAWMAANYLKTLPYIDGDRMGVWGLSYGGFFTLIAVTDQPQLFACGIDVAGVVDYAMYYDDPYHGGWTASRIGTPAENPSVYAKASPISHIDRLAKPLLVLHGTADVNVPYLHSVRLVDEALKAGKGPLLEFMSYPGEFHYFTREHVLRDAWTRSAAFFDRWLKPDSTTSSAAR